MTTTSGSTMTGSGTGSGVPISSTGGYSSSRFVNKTSVLNDDDVVAEFDDDDVKSGRKNRIMHDIRLKRGRSFGPVYMGDDDIRTFLKILFDKEVLVIGRSADDKKICRDNNA